MPLLALSRRRVWPLALLAVLLAVAGTVVVSLWLAMERQPRVDAPGNAVSLDDVARARDLLRHNDPRRALPGITRAVVLSQRDLELLLQQAGQRLGGAAQTARGRVRLQPGLAVVEASLPLAAWPGGGWLNLRAVLRESDGLPTVQALRIGRLPLPGWLAEAALPRLLEALNLRAQGELAQKMVSRVGFRAQALVLAYAWPDNAEQVLTASLLTPDTQARLRRHADHLASQVPGAGGPGGAAPGSAGHAAGGVDVPAGSPPQPRRRQCRAGKPRRAGGAGVSGQWPAPAALAGQRCHAGGAAARPPGRSAAAGSG
jgi:hypothetical protein